MTALQCFSGEGDKIKILDDLSCESDFEADFENLYLDENAIFDEVSIFGIYILTNDL